MPPGAAWGPWDGFPGFGAPEALPSRYLSPVPTCLWAHHRPLGPHTAVVRGHVDLGRRSDPGRDVDAPDGDEAVAAVAEDDGSSQNDPYTTNGTSAFTRDATGESGLSLDLPFWSVRTGRPRKPNVIRSMRPRRPGSGGRRPPCPWIGLRRTSGS